MRRAVLLLAAMAAAVLALGGAAWEQSTASADLWVIETVKPKRVVAQPPEVFGRGEGVRFGELARRVGRVRRALTGP